MHLNMLFPFILSTAGLVFFGWHVLFPKRAIEFHMRYSRYGAFYPPQKNRFYFWFMIVLGALGSILFGIAAVGAGLELF